MNDIYTNRIDRPVTHRIMFFYSFSDRGSREEDQTSRKTRAREE